MNLSEEFRSGSQACSNFTVEVSKKTPAMPRDIFRLQLKAEIENLPPPW